MINEGSSLNVSPEISNNYIIDLNNPTISVDGSSHQTGTNTAILVFDGVEDDAEKIIIQ